MMHGAYVNTLQYDARYTQHQTVVSRYIFLYYTRKKIGCPTHTQTSKKMRVNDLQVARKEGANSHCIRQTDWIRDVTQGSM